MSGPGPFLRFPSLDVRVVCFTRVASNNYAVPLAPWGHGSTSEFAVKPYRSSTTGPAETARQQCSRDENVRGFITVAYGHQFSLQNNLFPDNLEDKQFKVKAESVSVRFMGRTAGDAVDIGFGFDMFMFHGKAFDGFTRFFVEPVRVSVAPFVALNNSARARAFHLTVAPKILLGSVDQDDFCNTSECTVAPRQFSAKAETLWSATVEVDILTLIRGN
ncbi:MAG TPA: hypothetical protein VFO31_28170 [Vicinamibacterales bacterium]|nr:hypothetical protein [Vicinamibacterales bacterium]